MRAIYLRTLLLTAAAAAPLQSASAAQGTVFTYDLITNPASPTAIPDGGCIDATATVGESFSGAFIALGVQIAHTARGQVEILIDPPGAPATFTQVAAPSADVNDNYNITLSSFSDVAPTGALNDGDVDVVASPRADYRRLVPATNINNVHTGAVNGTWTVRFCDTVTDAVSGTLQRSRLILRNPTDPVFGACGYSPVVGNVNPGLAVGPYAPYRTRLDWSNFGAVPNGIAFPGAGITVGGVTITEAANSGESLAGGAVPSFRLRTDTLGVAGHYRFQTDANAGFDNELDIEWVELRFDRPVSDLYLPLWDVDRGGNNTSWEDYARVEAWADDAKTRRISHHASIADTQLSFAGDWVDSNQQLPNEPEGLASLLDARVEYRFSGPVQRVRVFFAHGDGNAAGVSGHGIAIGDLSWCAFDYGDAPNSYLTNLAANGARHDLGTRQLFMGTAPDGETDRALVPDQDDAEQSPDDEDGVASFPTRNVGPTPPEGSYTCGAYTTPQPVGVPGPNTDYYCVAVQVTNQTAVAAQLVGWVDFNGDGDFNDAGERSQPDLGTVSGALPGGSFTTGNVPAGTTNQTAVLVWERAPQATDPGDTAARFRLTTDSDFYADGPFPSSSGLADDGEVEDYLIARNTLPVTLASFESLRLAGNRVRVQWSTATESGTLGYHILQQQDGALVQLNRTLIPSQVNNSHRPQFYQVELDLRGDGPLVIEEVSMGDQDRHGPYALGSSRGSAVRITDQDWTQARAEVVAARMREDAQRLAGGRGAGAVAELRVSRNGLQRVTLADLSAAGIDWSGQPAGQLRLRTTAGQLLPVRATGGATLGAGSVIEFRGEAVTDNLYSRERTYLLDLAGGGASWTQVDAAPEAGLSSRLLRQEVALDQDREYFESSPASTPWHYETVRRGASPVSRSWNLNLAENPVASGARVQLVLWGGLDYPGGDADHPYRLSVNGTVVRTSQFDGVSLHHIDEALPSGLLRQGNNEVRLELLVGVHPADVVRVDRIALAFTAGARAVNGSAYIESSLLQTQADQVFATRFEDSEPAALACGSGCTQMAVGGFPNPDVVVLQEVGSGFVELTGFTVSSDGAGGQRVTVRPQSFVDTDGSVFPLGRKLEIHARSSAATPRVRPAAATVDLLAGGPAQLLILASERFLPAVEPLAQLRRSQGLSVRVVDVNQIYPQFSAGVVDAQGIKTFVAAAYQQLGTRYLLLAGGDTYDYLNNLGTGSISDVPTLYRYTHPVTRFAPVDAAYGDLDGDGAPELAVGRLPARTLAEMQSYVTKIVAHDPTAAGRSSLWVADRANEAGDAVFGEEVETIIGTVAPGWTAGVQVIDLQDYAPGNPGVTAARTDIAAAINSGRTLVSFLGHGAPSRWSQEGLLEESQLEGLLTVAGKATIVAEYGCWGGYFVDPGSVSMSQRWSGLSNRGSLAYISSSGLTRHDSDIVFAKALSSRITSQASRIGDLLVAAKQEIHADRPERIDVLFGVSLFGDPTMPIQP